MKEKYVFLCADGEYVKQLSGRLLVLKLKYSSKSLLPLIIFLLFEGKLWLCKFYYNNLELVTYFSENFRATGWWNECECVNVWMWNVDEMNMVSLMIADWNQIFFLRQPFEMLQVANIVNISLISSRVSSSPLFSITFR